MTTDLNLLVDLLYFANLMPPKGHLNKKCMN